MFFRRPRPRPPAWEERLQRLREAGFEVPSSAEGRVSVRRGPCVAVIEPASGAAPRILMTGRFSGAEVARLVDGGFQKFWRTPAGKQAPALAEHLSELHSFLEDLREALGQVSYYHTSLGTTNDLHLYDRVSPPSASNSR